MALRNPDNEQRTLCCCLSLAKWAILHEAEMPRHLQLRGKGPASRVLHFWFGSGLTQIKIVLVFEPPVVHSSSGWPQLLWLGYLSRKLGAGDDLGNGEGLDPSSSYRF